VHVLPFGWRASAGPNFRIGDGRTFSSKEFHMGFEEIKAAIMTMDISDQRRLIMEVVPQMWERACEDPTCALKLKELVDKDIIHPYDEMFMGGI
jgi:hypothetical protein